MHYFIVIVLGNMPSNIFAACLTFHSILQKMQPLAVLLVKYFVLSKLTQKGLITFLDCIFFFYFFFYINKSHIQSQEDWSLSQHLNTDKEAPQTGGQSTTGPRKQTDTH